MRAWPDRVARVVRRVELVLHVIVEAAGASTPREPLQVRVEGVSGVCQPFLAKRILITLCGQRVRTTEELIVDEPRSVPIAKRPPVTPGTGHEHAFASDIRIPEANEPEQRAATAGSHAKHQRDFVGGSHVQRHLAIRVGQHPDLCLRDESSSSRQFEYLPCEMNGCARRMRSDSARRSSLHRSPSCSSMNRLMTSGLVVRCTAFATFASGGACLKIATDGAADLIVTAAIRWPAHFTVSESCAPTLTAAMNESSAASVIREARMLFPHPAL